MGWLLSETEIRVVGPRAQAATENERNACVCKSVAPLGPSARYVFVYMKIIWHFGFVMQFFFEICHKVFTIVWPGEHFPD